MLHGMANQNGEKGDDFFVEDLVNHLFEDSVDDRGGLIWKWGFRVWLNNLKYQVTSNGLCP